MKDTTDPELDNFHLRSSLDDCFYPDSEDNNADNVPDELTEHDNEVVSEFCPPTERETEESATDETDFAYPQPKIHGLPSYCMPDATWLTAFLVSLSYTVKFFFARFRHFLQYHGWEEPKGTFECDKHRVRRD